MDEKKAELCRYLRAEQAVAISYEVKVAVSTYGKDILCNNIREDNTVFMLCTHEEADTILLLHVADCVKQGYHKISVWTVDCRHPSSGHCIIPSIGCKRIMHSIWSG